MLDGIKKTKMRSKLTENFYLDEFDCKDGTKVPGEYVSDVRILAKNLQILRDELNRKASPTKPEIRLRVRSGFRTLEHHKEIYKRMNLGAAPMGSFHLKGMAADIEDVTKTFTPKQIFETAKTLINEKFMTPGGLKAYSWGVHYDIRGYFATW